MKIPGIVGGTGPESTVDYYQAIISKYQERLNNKEVLPELLINSINMYKIFDLLTNERTEELANYLAESIQRLERAGADFAIMAANTPHIVFEEVQQQVRIPMISIVEETYIKSEEMNLTKTGLLGTKFTMESDFFKKTFTSHNRDIFVPTESEQEYIHTKIVEELENGIVKENTKQDFLTIARRMRERDGIEGLILGCTELPMIIKEGDVDIPQLNTTEIHVDKVVEMIFSE